MRLNQKVNNFSSLELKKPIWLVVHFDVWPVSVAYANIYTATVAVQPNNKQTHTN